HREEPDRHLSTAEVPQLLALDPGRDQVADRDGEDGVDLAWAGTPLIRVRCHADDGRDVKARSHGLDVVETAEHADVRRVQSDLLLGLAQRGRLGIGVALVAAPARKRYLALVVRQRCGATGEEYLEARVGREQRDEHGRGRLVGWRQLDAAARRELAGERGE